MLIFVAFDGRPHSGSSMRNQLAHETKNQGIRPTDRVTRARCMATAKAGSDCEQSCFASSGLVEKYSARLSSSETTNQLSAICQQFCWRQRGEALIERGLGASSKMSPGNRACVY
jgi:hypothetical protein